MVRMRCLVVVSPLETAVCRHDEHARALTQMYFTCLSPVRLNDVATLLLVWFGSVFPGFLGLAPSSLVLLVWLRLHWFSLAEFSKRLVFPQSFQDFRSQEQSHQTTDLSLSLSL